MVNMQLHVQQGISWQDIMLKKVLILVLVYLLQHSKS